MTENNVFAVKKVLSSDIFPWFCTCIRWSEDDRSCGSTDIVYNNAL